jgi:hypothetical protein
MAVRDGFVSICPLHLDLTHYESLELLRRDWEGSISGMLAAENAP